MTKIVNAEYLIASMFIKKNASLINLEELGRCGIFLQSCSVGNNIDAVFVTSKPNVINTIYDFSDYFEFTKDSDYQITGVKICDGKDITDLNYRFMGYLPEEIETFIEETIDKFLEMNINIQLEEKYIGLDKSDFTEEQWKIICKEFDADINGMFICCNVDLNSLSQGI